MIELRIHGRGGQGAVVASKVLAEAAFRRGHDVQSYPDYGVERRGAPVVAFARIADPGDDILVRQDITEPDHVLVLDPVLLTTADVVAGLRPDGWVVVNTTDLPETLGIPAGYRVATIDASGIALRHGLGSRAQPVVNTAILGAFARVTGIIDLDAVLDAIATEIPAKRTENLDAAREAYDRVVIGASV